MTRGVVQPERYRRGMCRERGTHVPDWDGSHHEHARYPMVRRDSLSSRTLNKLGKGPGYDWWSVRAVRGVGPSRYGKLRTHRLERRWAAAEIRREVAA